MNIKRIDEKHTILSHYNDLINSIDSMQLLSIYLKCMIDNVESDKDILEMELELPLIANLFSISSDKIFRYKSDIDKLFNKLNITDDLKLEDERFINVSKRLIEYAKKQDDTA